MNKKVLVAMSGGVDSSVAAYLLKEEGYDLVGITMKLFCYGEGASSPKSCCSLEAINDAKGVCDRLGIPHYVVDYEKEFEREVVADFVSEYQKGRTPNPCIRCNQFIKFSHLAKKAKELGCDNVATGHYAKVVKSEKLKVKSYRLVKGVDTAKDQTYFLYRLDQKQLAQLKFPLGKLKKSEVRQIAKKVGLKVAEKTESQEICFVDKNISAFLKDRVKLESGDILDKSGKKIGEHEGLPLYTIGQRKGLGGGFKGPMYVVCMDVAKKTITVGEEGDLYKKEVFFNDASWISGEPSGSEKLTATIRYNMKEKAVANLEKMNGKYKTVFKDNVRAVTPGQSIVFYSGDECLGGGVIT